MGKLQKSFYIKEDVVFLSKKLLGKHLFSRIGNMLTGGIITETEAYNGIDDRASHAFGNRRTNRTEIMYMEGGVAYVYLCYGIHSLFNVITNSKGIPHAILIRGLLPTTGIDIMKKRRNNLKAEKNLTNGPGKISQALGITCSHTGASLLKNTIWIEDKSTKIATSDILISKRVGVDYAGKDADLLYRFHIKENALRNLK